MQRPDGDRDTLLSFPRRVPLYRKYSPASFSPLQDEGSEMLLESDQTPRTAYNPRPSFLMREVEDLFFASFPVLLPISFLS